MTLLICTDDARVDEHRYHLQCCKQRTKSSPARPRWALGIESTMPMEVTVGGATVMVTMSSVLKS